MNGEHLHVSVVEPLTPAIERVKTMLFRPFDLGKWFVIGFCAWLAELGKPHGGGIQIGGRGGPSLRGGRPDVAEIMDRARDFLGVALNYVQANLYWILPVAVMVIAFSILITWLSSRGRFMFLHCVAGDKAEVTLPWKKFSRHGDSLFVFRIVLGFISLIAVGAAVYTGILLFAGAALTGSGGAAVMVVVAVFISMIVLGVVLSLIQKLTTDFVAPIMFLRTESCTAAWREFLGLLSANMGRFALYILFQIVIWLGIGILILAIACLTCCCAACILGIPYIGTVLMLPIYVFHRSYTLYYLRQYGPAFDLFGAMEPAVSAKDPA
jgi:hypothetical protein